MKKSILLTGLALCAVTANAQCYKDGYVDWGYGSPEFADAVNKWAKDKFYNADDNFFISRVKPKIRFRNEATQIRDIKEADDKKLLNWFPINNPLNNALPDGKFDSEVFNMWSYVTHYGDWTASLGRIPAALIDVAHKNGVAVSGVASIPYGKLNMAWRIAINDYVQLDAQQAADFLHYYGNDGIGYNSEFEGGNSKFRDLPAFHEKLVKASAKNPLFENIWYDGTDDRGTINFDHGLSQHNQKTFGEGDQRRVSLFFNYNWSSDWLLGNSVKNAEKLKRNSLDLYAGINMQGGEPKNGINWTMLKNYAISIGLWGAHQQNMFWESRNEQGSTDDAKQRTYMLRTERWYSGGTRNPANCPPIIDKLSYSLPNTDFPGMSSMMSARSALNWDLSEEPFMTFFNLGNGKFFNWKGVRQNDNQWYNIGIQDYLPTWRYWFADKLLGKNAADVPQSGLDAEFIWDDAYLGGSCMRVFGTTANEYLHLFKTKYALQAGDVITVRYKLIKGAADARLVLTTEGNENTPVNEEQFKVMTSATEADEDTWVEKTFTVGEGLAGQNLALVALHFQNAKEMNLYLGEFSIVRGTAETPAKPVIVSAKSLAFHKNGVDGKLIFNMENDKPAGTPCYNSDVKTSLFRIYSQQEGAEPVCVGATTSWASLIYNAPVNFKSDKQNVRFGVSAVSLDGKKESDIAWSEYQQNVAYAYNDDIAISKTTLKPNEAFTISYVDPNHESGTWKLLNSKGEAVFQGDGTSISIDGGLKDLGTYDVILTGKVNDKDGNRIDQERRFNAFIQITPESIGALPEIKTLTANNEEAEIKVDKNTAVNLAYTGRPANGKLSRGISLKEKGFGFRCVPSGFTFGQNPWSCSFWVKFNALADGGIQFFDVRDQNKSWPKDNWGLFWSTYDKKEKLLQFVIRGSYDMEHSNSWYIDFTPGTWTHITITMENKKDYGVREHVFVNGVEAKCVKYKNGGMTDEGYNPNYSRPTDWSENYMVVIGRGRHQCAAMDAVVDDVKFFNRQLKKDEIQKVMNGNEIIEGQTVYYSFDKEANSDHEIANEGTATVNSGALGNKGWNGDNGCFDFIEPTYDAGSPYIAGSKYEVNTVPTWKAKKGVITDAQGDDKAGSAKVTYANDGIYDVVLTLTNSYGSDTKTFKSIIVGTGDTGIENADLTETEVTVENGIAFIDFASEGDYTVQVYNAAGQIVASQAQHMTEGQKAQIALGHPGVYILQVTKNGQKIANVKLLNK